ncbi:hypothetical protein PRIPAC_83799 [Pristionchus pacificus]|uniref:Uncharacterized protein n=1 Tax=Pristionchus pacificus TaxID=54126 RepID=A0A2A6BU33_PRIPA|nr:hypothetical protein PRIPAC_83799 [Pristionchus pacificus]|eukprot:PDM69414.1 hypothetical protein PRIPAC_44510 [Pristionchus pacificus]
MRFPLVIPPVLLLILNWSSLDSDAVAFHNGSFVAVQSLDHIQFANISSIDGNFATRNTRYRNSSTHDVKPLALIDNVYNSEDIVPFHFIPDPQDSRGKRQKRDSQEDELAQAEKNVTDLTGEIGNIIEQLKEKEEEAKVSAKASVETLEKSVAVWKDAEKARLEWESANEELTNSNTELDEATKNLKAANETLEAAVKELERVEGEPELLRKLTVEFHRLDPIYRALQTAVDNWETELPLLQKAVTDAQSYVTHFESKVARTGCVGKATEDGCPKLLFSLDQFRTTRDKKQAAFDAAEADNIKKTEELAQCEPNWKDLKEKIRKLNTDVAEPRHGTKLLMAQSDVNIPADGAEGNRAYEAAKLELGIVNTIKNVVDGEVNNLKSQLKEKNIELEQANAKVEALKQSKVKETTKTGNH